MNDNKNDTFADFDLIHVYSRKQALEDGVLIDVSEVAKEAGFRYPVAVTSALWADIHTLPADQSGQDVNGRLWDVLTMGIHAIRQSKQAGSELLYGLIMPVGRTRNYTVKLHCGPGDDAEPVITLMLPGED